MTNEEQPVIGEGTPASPGVDPGKAPEPSGPDPRQVRRNWMVIAVMAVALAGMIWMGVRNAKKNAGPGGDSLTAANVKGKTAPDFELQDVATGKPVRLADYRGKAILLNFWATWCPPCKVEIPWFVDLQKQYGGDGLVVLGVAMDDAGQQEIAKFAQDMGINYPVLLGTDKVGTAYGGVEALPTTFYIGRDGKVVDRSFGLHSHREVEQSIRSALNTSANSAALSTSSESGK